MHTRRSLRHRPRPRAHARPAPCARPRPAERYLIVNADDFGADDAVNRGIVEAHARGIVTSTSLMVDMPAARAAVQLARAHPRLGLGLHVNFTAGAKIPHPGDRRAQREALQRQLDQFTDLTGDMPTHVDSHHHVHCKAEIAPLFVELCREHRLPLRHFSPIAYVGGFYGQWEVGKTDIRHISPEHLIALLGDVAPGCSELACHPGDADVRFDPIYDWERRIELDALTDPRVGATARRQAIRLISFRDNARLAPAPAAEPASATS